jgi:hypothetical protein
MLFEPGPLDPLDRAAVEIALRPSASDGAAADFAGDVAPLQTAVDGLDQVRADVVAGATPNLGDDAAGELDQAGVLVDSVDGPDSELTDASVLGSIAAHSGETQSVYDDVVDAPDWKSLVLPAGAANPTPPLEPGPKTGEPPPPGGGEPGAVES